MTRGPGTRAARAGGLPWTVPAPLRTPPGCLDWLTVEPPDERLGWSIYLYRVDAARIARLAAKRGTVTPFARTGPR